MRQRIQLSLVLFLCFLATGAQWDLLQTFAWGRMMANNSRAMPLGQAVAKTFDGEMCGLCRLVANAKKQEQSAANLPNPKLESRIVFFFQPVPKVIVAAPCSIVWMPDAPAAMTATRSAPPVPPPRARFA